MTRHRRRLQMLVDEVGSQRRLAELVSSAPSYISQLLNIRPGINRTFLERLERCTGKPDGWMDQWLPDEGQAEAADDEQLLLTGFRNLQPSDRSRLMNWLSIQAAGDYEIEAPAAPPPVVHEKG